MADSPIEWEAIERSPEFRALVGWIAGVGLIALTWVVSFAYLRRSDSEWSPMERRIAAAQREATGRFARDEAPVREEVR